MTIRRILVPTDFSAHADAALEYAIALAAPLGATVALLHVIEDPLAVGMWATELYSAEIAGLQINLSKDADERLRRMVGEPGREVITDQEVRIGRAAGTIGDAAAETKADLIVMGTAGRTGLSHLFMGSVAERVVRTAPCPVLTVRAAVEKTSAPNDRAATVSA